MKEYIGDGVYVCIERGMVCLSTENGVETTNTIFLEPEVYASLVRYVMNIETQNGPQEMHGSTDAQKP